MFKLEKIRLTIERLDQGIGIIFVLLAVSACVSEAMSRNAVRLILLLAAVRVCLEPGILRRLREYRAIMAAMAAMVLMLAISAIAVGTFCQEFTKSTFWYNYNMLLFPALMLGIRTKKQLRNIWWGLMLSLFIVDLYIFWQAWHGVMRPNTFMKGTFMLTAMFYVILLPGMITLALQKKQRNRWLYIFLIIAAIAAVFVNSTRGAWLALSIVTVVLFLLYKKWKELLLIFAAAGFLLGGICWTSPAWQARLMSVGDMNDQSHAERMLMWESAFHMAMDHPLLGVGFGNYTEAYQHTYILPQAKEPNLQHAHSNFMQFLAEDGIFGLVVYCGSAGCILYWFGKRRRNKFAMMVFAGSLALLFYSTNDYTFAGYAAMRVYWLLLGFGAKGMELSERERLEENL